MGGDVESLGLVIDRNVHFWHFSLALKIYKSRGVIGDLIHLFRQSLSILKSRQLGSVDFADRVQYILLRENS